MLNNPKAKTDLTTHKPALTKVLNAKQHNPKVKTELTTHRLAQSNALKAKQCANPRERLLINWH
jgi:hypothetical protein